MDIISCSRKRNERPYWQRCTEIQSSGQYSQGLSLDCSDYDEGVRVVRSFSNFHISFLVVDVFIAFVPL